MISSIPYAEPAAPVAHGLLNLPATDLLGYVLIGLVALAGLFLMPGQLRESLASLWAPVGRALAALRCPWLWMGAFALVPLLAALRPILVILGSVAILMVSTVVLMVRLAYSGFDRPVLT
jgi:hypothetical protein